jgi:hypothetical protein
MNLKLLTHRYFWYDLKWKIRNFFFPQNKWLRNLVGKDYCEPQWIIENVLFTTLVNFVEQEDGLNAILNYDVARESLRDDHITQDYINFREPIRKQVESAYNYIKNTRPQLEMKKDSLYPKCRSEKTEVSDWLVPNEGGKSYRMTTCEERYGMSYEESYGPVNDLEEEIKALDTFYLKIIIDNREALWS